MHDACPGWMTGTRHAFTLTMATIRASAWSGSSRVLWLMAALLLLMALLALLGLSRAALQTPAAASLPTALRPCSLPDVRVERAESLSATLLPRQLRAPSSQICAARC